MVMTVEEFLFGEQGLVRLIDEQDYKRALQVIIENGQQFPEVARTVNYHRICLAATLGDVPQALWVLREMLEAGVYYPPMLLGDQAEPPGLGPLPGIIEFEKLKRAHQDHYTEAMQQAAPVLVTVMPQPPLTAPPPLLLALHGNVSNVTNEVEIYQSITTRGWMLAMPQSSQPWGMEGRFVWGDWQVTIRQLEDYWRSLNEQPIFDPDQIVTTGISKGGEVAIWLALSGTVPARGFVAVAPGGPHIEEPHKLLPLLEANRERGLRGYLIVGDQDNACYEATLNFSDFLEAQEFPHQLVIVPGLRHWFPIDFANYLNRALSYIISSG